VMALSEESQEAEKNGKDAGEDESSAARFI
jgi:hypothetical protein